VLFRSEAESKALLSRAAANATKIESLKNYVKNCMILAGKDKINSSKNSVSLCNNSVKSVVLSDDFDKTPFTIKVEVEKFDTKLIKEKLEAGEAVDGACLKQEQHIRIK
jgi:hypothetical protein